MKLQLLRDAARKLFSGYDHEQVMINRQPFGSGTVVYDDVVRQDWGCTEFAALNVTDFDFFLPLKPEVLLIGTGARQQFAHPALYRNLLAAGIAVEFMDTAAVCRTYNILASEDRRVVAAILL